MTDDPHESRLRERVAAAVADGCRHMHVSWTPGASALSREERAAELNRWLDAEANGEFEVIDFIDSNR